MIIVHKIDEFLFSMLFPELRTETGNEDRIISELIRFYTYGPYKPKVSIENGWARIEIDTPTIVTQEADYRKVVALCDKGKFVEAKPILNKLIEKNPTNSEYHRIMGQILSDEGDQEEAINSLIDALRWDSKNEWALIMMGNIFAKFKDDIEVAMKYYDQALIAKPNDNIARNNIGANLMQKGRFQEAKKYFKEAIGIDDEYPNTHFALGMIAEIEGDLHSAFNSTVKAIKFNKNKDVLYQKSVSQAFGIAKKVISTDAGKKIYREYLHKLEFAGDRRIDVVQDEEIPTVAVFEFAENHNRETHIIKYKPNYPAIEHLIMHELVHLDLVIQARNEGLNQIFISDQAQKRQFIKGLEPTIKKFNKMGFSDKSIADYCSSLFEGLNRQIYNAPIDLFIENFLFNEFAELRPYQFISLYNMLQEAMKAVTDKKLTELSPREVLSQSKIYNLVNAIQFKELFGFDFIKDFAATPSELKLANDFYAEYLEYRDDKETAEEYELVVNWAKDLKLDKNFELVDELAFRTKRTNIENLLESIENDPYDLEVKDPGKERDSKKFEQSQKDIGTNMAVAMYMVEALQHFEDKPKEEIKKVAYEIALQGTQGYSPEKKNYRISSIPNKTFSGYHILAYYYVSWALAIPEMLEDLHLPFHEEYQLAKTLRNTK